MLLDPTQERAVELACEASFAVVTGGPGTGKSTCMRVALDRMDARGESYFLASPTGKAAKRMTEATGRPASTLHMLLGIDRRGKRISQEYVRADAVLVDETSMMDIELAATLMESVSPRTRVIFVGDANQLPSVGPGRVLADLVESDAVPVARLSTVHRAAAESWVCRNAPRVLAGENLELEARRDFRFCRAESAEEAARVVSDLVAGEFKGAQVLSPQRTTACGVTALNTSIQARLNPSRGDEEDWKIGDKLFRRGDRVIQTVNNYKIESEDGGEGVFNGEVGEVVEVGPRMVVDFGDRRVIYTKEHAAGLDLAYALTVHKSQGSEFPWVIMVVHSAHTFMLTRQLFYTGITRAKKGVIIVGNEKGLGVATSSKEPPKRFTGLIQRMREYDAEPLYSGLDKPANDSGSSSPASPPEVEGPAGGASAAEDDEPNW